MNFIVALIRYGFGVLDDLGLGQGEKLLKSYSSSANKRTRRYNLPAFGFGCWFIRADLFGLGFFGKYEFVLTRTYDRLAS
ncbi:hypothetical protein [Pedobacter gandavensis]|uniref:hypothetical protein n=1 Tax=Pedobacter gandavensis TaxID=2679963 RepID=UPI00292E71E6|nr:hypothetical protein [Pedobacter gandavensis]